MQTTEKLTVMILQDRELFSTTTVTFHQHVVLKHHVLGGQNTRLNGAVRGGLLEWLANATGREATRYECSGCDFPALQLRSERAGFRPPDR